jgi:hypothetical protein
MMRGNHQVIEIKAVNVTDGVMSPKKRGSKYEGMSTEVVENTCRKNVRFWV